MVLFLIYILITTKKLIDCAMKLYTGSHGLGLKIQKPMKNLHLNANIVCVPTLL